MLLPLRLKQFVVVNVKPHPLQDLAVDINKEKLDFAESVGVVATVNVSEVDNTSDAVFDISSGGVHVSIDALGSSAVTCFNSISNLRKRRKHIQVGLMLADHRNLSIPMNKVTASANTHMLVNLLWSIVFH